MIDQLPKQGGGQLLPFKGSIDRLPPTRMHIVCRCPALRVTAAHPSVDLDQPSRTVHRRRGPSHHSTLTPRPADVEKLGAVATKSSHVTHKVTPPAATVTTHRVGCRMVSWCDGGERNKQMHQLESIRRAPLIRQRAFLNDPPPAPVKPNQQPLKRVDASIPSWFFPWAQTLLPLPDEFIAHLTRCAPCRNRPRGWRVHKSVKAFCRALERHTLVLIPTDKGWLIGRDDLLTDESEILTHMLLDAPVLCPSCATAARVAEACYPEPPPIYGLAWFRAQ